MSQDIIYQCNEFSHQPRLRRATIPVNDDDDDSSNVGLVYIISSFYIICFSFLLRRTFLSRGEGDNITTRNTRKVILHRNCPMF
jgi:hypothetical protein